MRVTGYYIGYLMCRLASPVIEYIVKLQGSELNLCAICFYYFFFAVPCCHVAATQNNYHAHIYVYRLLL